MPIELLSTAWYSPYTIFGGCCSNIPELSLQSLSPPDTAHQYLPKSVVVMPKVVSAAFYDFIGLLLVCYPTLKQ
jgi:hypothetical protein